MITTNSTTPSYMEIRRQQNRDTLREIQTYFSIHAHLSKDSLYYLKQHWDNDVGFIIIPDRYLKLMLTELYIMRHHPAYKEIKDQIAVNEKRKKSLADTMAIWLAAQPQINTATRGQYNALQVNEVHIQSSVKVYETYMIGESFIYKSNKVLEYEQRKQCQTHCWYCDESWYFNHRKTDEHKEVYWAYMQYLSAALMLPVELIEKIMIYVYPK